MHSELNKGTLYYRTEDNDFKEIGTIESGGYIGIDFANEEDNTVVELTNGEVSFSLDYISTRKYHKRKKGKRYLVYSYTETTLYDDFLEKVFKVKNKNKKIKKLGTDIR